TLHFSADFVVIDFDADPRVSLILERSFLRTRRALIDVYEGELTLRVGKQDVTFNLDQTSRYSANYDAMSVIRIDLIDISCEEYSQEVLGFSVKTDAFLAVDDEPISPEIDGSYYDSEGDILLLEEFLNDDPSLPPLPPQELKFVKPTNEKYSIDKPPVVELKDLPPHLEYAFLEGDDKLPVIIAKDLKDEEKTALMIAWKLFDIKGDHRKVQLNELNELRDQAYENYLIYKEKTKRIHDSKIKDRIFNISDRVLFNSRLKIFLDKLKTRWSGPFTITQVFLYGTIELS
nr:reverse transcriptase domain-containing protein [Tanacetum cinerariifolium]